MKTRTAPPAGPWVATGPTRRLGAPPPPWPPPSPRRVSEASRGAARRFFGAARAASGAAAPGFRTNLPLRAMAAHSLPDRQHRDALVGRVAALLAVQPRHPDLAALVVQRDHLPEPGVEHRAARAAALG